MFAKKDNLLITVRCLIIKVNLVAYLEVPICTICILGMTYDHDFDIILPNGVPIFPS